MKSSLELVILFKLYEGVVVFSWRWRVLQRGFSPGNGTDIKHVWSQLNLLIDWINLIADSLIADLKTA